MKYSNRPPLFSRNIHEKIARIVLSVFLIIVAINMAIKGFSSNFFVGILTIALLYSLFVMTYNYPILRGRRFPWRK